MALRIRDDVDLKELENYGFKYLDTCGQYEFMERCIDGLTYIKVNTWNKKVLYRQDIPTDNICLEKLYDLIKANLVVKE